jgi:3-oxoacyl-[acyl-carrier protein] reductase
VESRVIIVTGGATGLGRAMTLALLAAGHRIVVMSRTQHAIDELIATATARGDGERAHGVAGSVRSNEDCQHAVRDAIARFGRIDGLVNNAGVDVSTDKPNPKFFELSEDQWRAIVDTHLTGAFLMTRAIVPHLIAQGWGRIVNHETSYSTMLRPGFSAYGAAKAGLEAATVGWAQDLEGTGVTVNAILPGGVANVARISAQAFPNRDQLVQPEVMGPPIIWLISEASGTLTGYRITARQWEPDASEAENLAAAAIPAGWQAARRT